MEPYLLDGARTACQTVAEDNPHVTVHKEKIADYAASLPLDRAAQPRHNPECHYLGHGDDTAAFFLVLDAVNFGSGYHPHVRKPPGLSGYFSLASSLTRYFETEGAPSAQRLQELAPEDCAAIFGQDSADEVAGELVELQATALNHLGDYLARHFEGSYARLLEMAHHSAEELVKLLIEMPFFDDVAEYDGLMVPFYKRAQLAAADLHVAFDGHGWGRFDDIERLTIFADNVVPHVLRTDGILVYTEELAARIDAEEPIPAGAPEEVAIRASALHAVELMVQALQQAGTTVIPMKLDYLLWNRGQEPAYKQAAPRHRTRTVFY
ncbi:MAG: queuosine 5'-phosphate N-glycosylase/hydrolase [Candidatus Brocadiia bacterium]